MKSRACWTSGYIALLTLLFLAGCSGTNPDLPPSFPSQAASYHFTLSAQQGLRDLAGDFSTKERGADTGITLLPGEKVEIFALHTASILPGELPTTSAESTICQNSDNRPEPSLPCNAVLYSIGVNGQAQQVGASTEFIPDREGNLFMGVNAIRQAQYIDPFQITILVIPPGTAIGRWESPTNGFAFQGNAIRLSAHIFTQGLAIIDVQFTARINGQAPIVICSTPLHIKESYVCLWDMRLPNFQYHNGAIAFGFRIQRSQGQTLENPDGVRTGIARHVLTAANAIYAGYAVIDPKDTAGAFTLASGQWTVPEAHCSRGENSLSSVWVGLTGSTTKSKLAQTGTISGCTDGVPDYEVWWELFPAPAIPITEPVNAGDTITATVLFRENHFQISIQNLQQNWHFSTTQSGTVADTTTAECIIEAPTLVDPVQQVAPLTNFGVVSVFCQFNNGQAIGNGSEAIQYQMRTPSSNAVTSLLDQTGSTFTVQWSPR